jgi:superfamily I DNA and/or RNA helicase
MRADAKLLLKEARQLEQHTIESILDRADVICATASFDEELLGERWFDLVVIDEACQSTEPGCWISLTRGDKVVLAGDHCQLPPTVLSEVAARQGFAKSLMERQIELYGERISRLLTVQYRMHEDIMQFSSQQFYGGQLIADQSVSRHRLADLPGMTANPLTETPVLCIDTAGASLDDEIEPDGYSKLNRGEAEMVVRLTHDLLQSGVNPESIAIIAPYAAQVRLLRKMIHQTSSEEGSRLADNSPTSTGNQQGIPFSTAIEIDTVDGFQGREKEAVIISLVVSNNRNEIGFLADTRRINVALTRARRKLIVIGDSATLAGHEFYSALFEYTQSINAYQSVWQWQEI